MLQWCTTSWPPPYPENVILPFQCKALPTQHKGNVGQVGDEGAVHLPLSSNNGFGTNLKQRNRTLENISNSTQQREREKKKANSTVNCITNIPSQLLLRPSNHYFMSTMLSFHQEKPYQTNLLVEEPSLLWRSSNEGGASVSNGLTSTLTEGNWGAIHLHAGGIARSWALSSLLLQKETGGDNCTRTFTARKQMNKSISANLSDFKGRIHF